MKTRESIELVGNLCTFNEIIVLVISKRSNKIYSQKDSYFVLFPKGEIDTVSKERLKVLC